MGRQAMEVDMGKLGHFHKTRVIVIAPSNTNMAVRINWNGSWGCTECPNKNNPMFSEFPSNFSKMGRFLSGHLLAAFWESSIINLR